MTVGAVQKELQRRLPGFTKGLAIGKLVLRHEGSGREFSEESERVPEEGVVEALVEREAGIDKPYYGSPKWVGNFRTDPELAKAKGARLERNASGNGTIQLTCRYGDDKKKRRQFIGTEEAGAKLHYALSGKGAVEAEQCEGWVRFAPNVQRRNQNLTLEEAEERMNKSKSVTAKQAQALDERKAEERQAEALNRPALGTEGSLTESDSEGGGQEEEGPTAKEEREEEEEEEAQGGKEGGPDDKGEDWEHGVAEASDDEEMELKEKQLKQEEDDDEQETKHKQNKLQQELAEQAPEEGEGAPSRDAQDRPVRNLMRQLGVDSDESDQEDDEAEDEDDDPYAQLNPDQDEELDSLLSSAQQSAAGTSESQPPSRPVSQPEKKRSKPEPDEQNQHSEPSQKASKSSPSPDAVRRLIQKRGPMQAKDIKREFSRAGLVRSQQDEDALKQAIKATCVMRPASDGKKYLVLPSS